MHDQQMDRVWLPALRSDPFAPLRLFCFPYAGGSASTYSRWPDRLPRGIDVRAVQLPGRWNRLRETPLVHFDAVLRALDEVLPPLLDPPFVFFGHSLGALPAFEIACRLRDRGLPQPLQLFVSGRRAPQIPDSDTPSPDLDDDKFIERLRELNGTSPEVLRQPEL